MEALQASVEAARSHRPGTHIATPASASKDRAKRSAKAAVSTEEHSALSKSELAAHATELGIPGRSKMSREELEAAVGAATKPAKRRKAS